MAKRMFELVEGSSRKFWEVSLDGNVVATRYGKIGTAGQTTSKDEATPELARKLSDKLVAEKTKKGYVEVDGAPIAEAAAAPAPAPASSAPASEKPAKKAVKAVKAPKKSSPEYQALARGWKDVLSALAADAVLASEVAERVLGLLADPAGAAVADAETVLAVLAADQLWHDIQTADDINKSYKDEPERLLAARARNEAKLARQAERIEAKHRTLTRLLEAGCDPKKSAKGEANSPLEAFIGSLPRTGDTRIAFPWSAGDRTTAIHVMEAFAAAGDAGTSGTALQEAAHSRWPVWDWLLARRPDAAALRLTWTTLVGFLRDGLLGAEENEAIAARLPALAAQLREHGAHGLCFADGAGALAVALCGGVLPAVDALRTAGADIDAPASVGFVVDVQVPSNLLPRGHRGVPQWQRLVFPRGLTGRDVAESTLDAYDAWETILGEREGAGFGSLGHGRRQHHARVRALVETLVAQGCAASGRRKPRAPLTGEQLAPGFKAAVDAALAGCIARLGGDGAAAAVRLAPLDPGVFGALAYLKDASAAMWPLVPKDQAPGIGAAWLQELLGYGDGMVGPDSSDLGDYPPEARAVLRSGTWLATRGSEVAVLETSGRVVEITVRRGIVELAPDLATFVTQDLGKIAAQP